MRSRHTNRKWKRIHATLVSSFCKDVGSHGNISQSSETNGKRSQRDGFVEKSGEGLVKTQERLEVDELYRGIVALLKRGYSRVRLGAICLHSRQSRQQDRASPATYIEPWADIESGFRLAGLLLTTNGSTI